MRSVIAIAIFILLVPLWAAETRVATANQPMKKYTPEELKARREARMRKTGPIVVKPGSMQGLLVVANAQKKVPEKEIEKAATLLATATMMNVKMVTADALNPADALKSLGAAAAVYVIDNDRQNTVLVAPEERWAFVNVAKLGTNIGEDKLATRCRKQILRAFTMLCGGSGSQFSGNLMEAASVDDLDNYEEFLPVDVPYKMKGYLEKLGVTPKYATNYLRACREGWAPSPTNDIEKAIWDRVQNEKADAKDPTARWKRDFPEKAEKK